MISLKKRNEGFTIVELLIVIVVIAILAMLVLTTYSGIQKKARNSQRQTDIAALQTQIEAFFSENGYYPNLGNMNDAAWRTAEMKSLDTQALVDPKNPTQSSTLVATAAAAVNSYGYTVTDSADASCEADATQCAKYSLTTTFEGEVNGATTLTKSNLD